MTYVAILQGARGILFYSHARKGDPFYVREHPEHWAYLQRLGAELQALAPVLVSPAVGKGVHTENRSIDASLYDCLSGADFSEKDSLEKGLYLIAANTAHATPAVARHFPGIRQAAVRIVLQNVDEGQAELVGDAGSGSAQVVRCIPSHLGTFSDDFDPYAVHIYKIVKRGSKE